MLCSGSLEIIDLGLTRFRVLGVFEDGERIAECRTVVSGVAEARSAT